jgi:hypothetical protein
MSALHASGEHLSRSDSRGARLAGSCRLAVAEGWLEVEAEKGSTRIGMDGTLWLRHEYRPVFHVISGTRSTGWQVSYIPRLLIFHAGEVAAVLPGGWTDPSRVPREAPRKGNSIVVPGWWDYREFANLCNPAGIPFDTVVASYPNLFTLCRRWKRGSGKLPVGDQIGLFRG